jgi:hypothetical protein
MRLQRNDFSLSRVYTSHQPGEVAVEGLLQCGSANGTQYAGVKSFGIRSATPPERGSRMFARQREGTLRERPAGLDARFAPEEICRLEDLRRRYSDLQYSEQGLDIRRLEFARWLVHTGTLREDLGNGALSE